MLLGTIMVTRGHSFTHQYTHSRMLAVMVDMIALLSIGQLTISHISPQIIITIITIITTTIMVTIVAIIMRLKVIKIDTHLILISDTTMEVIIITTIIIIIHITKEKVATGTDAKLKNKNCKARPCSFYFLVLLPLLGFLYS